MTKDAQIPLDLRVARPALGRAAFFVAPANATALALVERWPRWPEGRLAVAGPAGAGKTHLAHVWAALSGARVLPFAALPDLDPVAADAALAVEDVDRPPAPAKARAAAEEALFHLCNRLGLGGGSLMLSGRSAPGFWPVALPDLRSRLEASAVAALGPPDDALLGAVLVKLFADRGVRVGPGVVRYLVARIERSFAAAAAVAARLDRLALGRGRSITVRLAAEALATPEAPCSRI